MKMMKRGNTENSNDDLFQQGTAEDIERERLRNKEIGELTGMWKGGLLINDDQGLVKKLLQTHPYPDIKNAKSRRPQLSDV